MQSSNPNCIFCQIVAGKIPSHRVYEDEDTLAFLDIRPVNEGHLLVIPKAHVPYFYDLDDQLYSKTMQTLKKISQAVAKSIQPNKVGLLVKGFDVNHAHFHVVPLYQNTDIHANTFEPTLDQLAVTAEKIRQAL